MNRPWHAFYYEQWWQGFHFSLLTYSHAGNYGESNRVVESIEFDDRRKRHVCKWGREQGSNQSQSHRDTNHIFKKSLFLHSWVKGKGNYSVKNWNHTLATKDIGRGQRALLDTIILGGHKDLRRILFLMWRTPGPIWYSPTHHTSPYTPARSTSDRLINSQHRRNTGNNN